MLVALKVRHTGVAVGPEIAAGGRSKVDLGANILEQQGFGLVDDRFG
jgi:hypothetical protein